MPKEETIFQPTERQIATLVKSLLGPEEEWDDAAVEFVLSLHGIDPRESKAKLAGLVDKIISDKTNRGEAIEESLRELQSSLKATPMAQDELVELTDDQIGILVRRLLGPPEEWDDVAVKFVLEVYGIDPSDAEAQRYMKSMLDRIVREKKERGELISQMLLNLEALSKDSPTSANKT